MISVICIVGDAVNISKEESEVTIVGSSDISSTTITVISGVISLVVSGITTVDVPGFSFTTFTVIIGLSVDTSVEVYEHMTLVGTALS